MKQNNPEKLSLITATLLSIGFAGWWLYNNLFLDPEAKSFELYSDSYWVIALVGAVIGLFVSRRWGGVKSLFGRSLIFLSLGLVAQVFGQVTYSYFAFVKGVEAPYPSLGDVGFFGSIIFYILGLIQLKKALGIKLSALSSGVKLLSLVVPALLLGCSYYVFLNGYEGGGNWVVAFLDFGYPLGQAVYISLALMIYLLSFKALGGVMRTKVLLLLCALVIQYIADFAFLYRFSRDQWVTGGFTDLIYQLSYFVMVLAMVSIGTVAFRLKSRSSK